MCRTHFIYAFIALEFAVVDLIMKNTPHDYQKTATPIPPFSQSMRELISTAIGQHLGIDHYSSR